MSGEFGAARLEMAAGGRGEKYTAHGGASIVVVYLKDESNGHAGSSLAAFLSFDSFMECVYLEMECFRLFCTCVYKKSFELLFTY